MLPLNPIHPFHKLVRLVSTGLVAFIAAAVAASRGSSLLVKKGIDNVQRAENAAPEAIRI
jgi:hypothetical protein